MNQEHATPVRNEVTVEGVVISKNIPLRQTGAGTYTTNFTIETREAGRGPIPVPVGIKAFGMLAKECCDSLSEGARVIIRGELASSQHQKVEVKAKTVSFAEHFLGDSSITEGASA